MKPKTKKTLASCALSLPLLASSVLCPILSVKNASADISPPVNVDMYTIAVSLFTAIGLKHTYRYSSSNLEYNSVMELYPYVIHAIEPNAQYNIYDGGITHIIDDFPDSSGNTTRVYTCTYTEPSWDDDEGIIDDNVPYVTCRDYFFYTNQSRLSYNIDSVFSIDVPVLINPYQLEELLRYLYYEDDYGTIVARGSCSVSYLIPNNGEWTPYDYYSQFELYDGAMIDVDITPDDIPDSVICSSLDITVRLDTLFPNNNNSYALNYESDPWELVRYVNDIPDLETYLDQNTTIITPPAVDVGSMIWQPVESFLNTEFIPNFTFGDMCLLALGLLLFGVFLKTFLGG